MSGQIAEFWASLGFRISPDEIKKVDKFLGDTEQKLKKAVGATKDQTKAQKEGVKQTTASTRAKEAEAKAATRTAKAVATQQKETQKLFTVTEKMRKGRERLLANERREVSRVAAATRQMQERLNTLFPAMSRQPLGARSDERRQLTSFYRGAFDKAQAGRFDVSRRVRGGGERLLENERRALAKTSAMTEQMQGRMNRLFPAMSTSPLGRGTERNQLTSFYRGAFDKAEAGRFDVRRRPSLAETTALRHIGKNNPAFSPLGGRVNEYFRRRAVEPEARALGSIGTNNPRFAPLGQAFSNYDQRLSSLQMAGQQGALMRSRAANLGRIDQRLSYLSPTKSPELRSMGDFYKRQSRTAREEEAAKKRGLRDEERIAELRRRAAVAEAQNLRMRQRMTKATPTMAHGLPSGGSSAFVAGTGGRSGASYGRANYLHAGGATGAFMRHGVASLPFIGGMYGVSALNRANQEVRSAELTTQAVAEAAGMHDQGEPAFEWFKDLSKDIGLNYMDSAQDYNTFLSNALGTGMSMDESQFMFQGMAEYSTAMGITPYRRKLVLNAMSQMFGKGQVQAEELNFRFAA